MITMTFNSIPSTRQKTLRDGCFFVLSTAKITYYRRPDPDPCRQQNPAHDWSGEMKRWSKGKSEHGDLAKHEEIQMQTSKISRPQCNLNPIKDTNS